MAKIAHNPLRFGEGVGTELQTRTKRDRKTTSVADARNILSLMLYLICNSNVNFYKHPFHFSMIQLSMIHSV